MYQKDIIITTLNARYNHASLGLRYLAANMRGLSERTDIKEFTIDERPMDIVERLLDPAPRIVGLGIYIWNVEQSSKVIALLKSVAPGIAVVIGGPEVSYEQEQQAIVELADYTITGMADLAFTALCEKLLGGEAPRQKILTALNPKLEELQLPYTYYTDHDISTRFVYVEASRGCPFKCEFCLSALDKTAWPFNLDRFLAEIDALYRRGARHFRFVDRTFNLKIKAGVRILEFFLERMDQQLFIHFEIVPDHLPQQLKSLIERFPPGSLQFEVGIQTLNPVVQDLISRKQNNDKAAENLAWLRRHTQAHLHVDLIFGLPGEDLASFARGFDRLVDLAPHEIQLGILKRLRGSPIIRHSGSCNMRFNPSPPYNILSTQWIDFQTMQRVNRFARYWDLIANSGRFKHSLPLILADSPFDRFLRLSDWIYATTRQTHRIALHKLFDLIYTGLTEELDVAAELAVATLSDDKKSAYTPPQSNPRGDFARPPRTGRRESRQMRHTT